MTMKRVFQPWLLAALLCGLAGCQPAKNPSASMKPEKPADPAPPAQVAKTDEEWRRTLTPDQYHVLREKGTERPNGPAYEEFKNQGGGTYVCAGCGAELFSSKHKFDSHCGWPSFYDPANAKNVITKNDFALGMVRTEVICAQCGGHLGHVFKGEGYKTPTDTRYCINGVSLKFIPAGATNQ
jgi:peptide-methionine (R)-S-oxide reductase